MKTMAAAKNSLLAMLVLAAAIFAGCKTTPAVDWNSRVGAYTYNQAVAELGPPDKQANMQDGTKVAQWITLHGSNGFYGGTGFVGGNYGVGAGQYTDQSYKDHVLELTFGTNSVLASWAKNY